jgi:hypothetical protein
MLLAPLLPRRQLFLVSLLFVQERHALRTESRQYALVADQRADLLGDGGTPIERILHGTIR